MQRHSEKFFDLMVKMLDYAGEQQDEVVIEFCVELLSLMRGVELLEAENQSLNHSLHVMDSLLWECMRSNLQRLGVFEEQC